MRIFALLLCVTLIRTVSAQEYCDSQCQRSLIDDYYSKINQAVQRHSTEEHIDTFLATLHDDVVYLHDEYEAEFNKSTWRQAFLRQMERGSYANTTQASTLVKSVIHGYQTAAVEFVSRYAENDDSALTASPPRLAIFKFKDNKIVFIQDHWYHAVE